MEYTMNAAAWALAIKLQDAIMMIDHNQDDWDLTERQRAQLAEIIAKYEEVTGIKHLTYAEHCAKLRGAARAAIATAKGVEP